MLAAQSDDDFVVAEPRPRPAPQRAAAPRQTARTVPARKPAKKAAKSGGAAKAAGSAALRLLGRGLMLAARQPLECALALTIAGAGGFIAWNALGAQTGKHPAPLFARSNLPNDAPLPPTRPLAEAVPTVTVPKPVTREPAPDRIGEAIRGADAKARPPEAPARPMPAAAAPAKPAPVAAAPRDPIGDLIRSDAKPASPVPPRDAIAELLKGENPVPPALVGSSTTVAAGQRALLKLGYGPLKADGMMGPGTRQAIERFERDRKLPVTGEVSGRTARELAAQSGIPVE
jgi:hypothetical protein